MDSGGVTKYDAVVSVIRKPPSGRNDFMVNDLIAWFRKRSRLFESLKTGKDVYNNLIQHVVYNIDYTLTYTIQYNMSILIVVLSARSFRTSSTPNLLHNAYNYVSASL